MIRWAPALGAMLLGLAGTVIFGRVMGKVYPVGDWLAWPMATLWGWVLLFNLACLGLGQTVLRRALQLTRLPAVETALFSMVIGTVAFGLALYAGGALALFRPGFSVALPCVFLAIGGYDGARLLKRCAADVRSAPYSPLSLVITAFGVLCVGLVYLGVMTPDSINYDASWYHLRMAQDYARWGRIAPFYDYNAIVPHLTSILNTWSYLVPGLDGAERWMMALHLEFSLLMWTLLGVAAGVQRLVGDFGLRGSWPAFFLFPIIFVYDNNLGGSADHVLAFFAIPVALATLQVVSRFTMSRCALLAITLAGASLTKYQAVYLMAPVAVVVSMVWLRAWMRFGRSGSRAALLPVRRQLWWGPVMLLGLGALLVSPHFLKNLIFYRNPVYPFLQDVIPSTPTVPDAMLYVDNIFTDIAWIPKGTFWMKLKHAAELFFTFSFQPHYSFTKNVPAFGSLFTLLLPGLAFVPRRRASAITAAIASGAILGWGMTYNVDRNLQTFMPVMVIVTGALVVMIWRLGWVARFGLVPLVMLQVIWGADAPFYSGHDRMRSAMDLIRSGFDGRAQSRFSGYRSSFVAIGNALPRDAKVVLHASHIGLGIDRDLLLDMQGFQGLISYHRVRTPRELFEYFRSLGITHLLEGQGLGESTKQEQIVYNLLLTRHAKPMGHFGGYRLAALPADAPPAEAPYHVLCVGLTGYRDGLYPIETLSTSEHLPAELRHFGPPQRSLEEASGLELLASADVVLMGGSRGDIAAELSAAFDRIPAPGDALYVRRR